MNVLFFKNWWKNYSAFFILFGFLKYIPTYIAGTYTIYIILRPKLNFYFILLQPVGLISQI